MLNKALITYQMSLAKPQMYCSNALGKHGKNLPLNYDKQLLQSKKLLRARMKTAT